MGKPTGFKEFKRELPELIAPEERVKNYEEFYKDFSDEKTKKQAARCMDCGVPFCHSGCPLGNIIPDFNDAVYREDWEEATDILFSTNNFPEFTGRICPAPCEKSCVLGINKPPVAIEHIEKTIAEKAFEKGYIKATPPKKRTGNKVAIVGSGPAGLAAADQLNKAGHLVTVYERADEIGGLLRYGIPDFKLDKSIVKRRIKLMADEGIKFITNANVGENVPVSKLQADFDAIVLAGGSTVSRDLPIPGRENKGVYFAMDFLTQQNRRVSGHKPLYEEIWATDKDVIVIGGGDTGSDCVGTSNRHGAKSITQIELMPKPASERGMDDMWPLWPATLRTSSSHEEGCERKWSIGTKEFVGENGILTGLKIVDLEWLPVKAGERPTFKEVAGTERVLPCDLTFLAMGFIHPQFEGMLEQLGVELDGRGNVKATETDYKTNVANVYVAGDMRRGQSLVVWAISEGREAARKVDEYLRQGESVLESKNASFYKVG